MADSTGKVRPKKPHHDFPLYAHSRGKWAKKVRGKVYYFGKWADPDGALIEWLDVRDDLLAGRTPMAKKTSGPTVRDVANGFMASRLARLEAGELTNTMHDQYLATCKRFVDLFGAARPVDDLRPEDFARLRALIARTNGPVSLGHQINRTRMAFRHAYEAALLDRPIRFGPDFKRPSARILRTERVKRGPKLFSAAEVWKIHDASSTAIQAMILLGINAAMGNADCGRLMQSHLDLKTGWLTFPRPKTGIERRCPLWPQTIEAIHAALKGRTTPHDGALSERIFITKYGHSFIKKTSDCPIAKEMRKTLKNVGVYRKGLGFYSLRHTFRTIADETRDFPAIDKIMGHAPAANDMGARYRERIDDARLVAVSDYVHDWLFSEAK